MLVKKKRLSTFDLIAISAFWCGANCMWGALLIIIFPKIVLDIVGAQDKGPALGFLEGTGAIVALILPLFVGGLSDRCMHAWGRRRPYIFYGTLITLIGLVLIWMSWKVLSFWYLVISFNVIQVGNNIALAAYSGIIPDVVQPSQRGIASGYMAVMSHAGTLLGVLFSGLLLTKSPFMAFVLIFFVLIACVALTLIGTHEEPLETLPSKIQWLPYIRSLWISPKKYPDFAWVWLTRFSVMLGFYGVQPFLQYYLKDIIHVSDAPKVAAYVGAILLGTATISGFIGGGISDRIGRKKVVYIANSLISLTCILFIFCRSLEHVIVVGILFGIGFGAYVSVDWALGTDVLPTKGNAAKEMAIWHIAMTLPQVLGAPLAGLLLASFGVVLRGGVEQYTHLGYTSIFLFATLFFALGAYGLRYVKKSS